MKRNLLITCLSLLFCNLLFANTTTFKNKADQATIVSSFVNDHIVFELCDKELCEPIGHPMGYSIEDLTRLKNHTRITALAIGTGKVVVIGGLIFAGTCYGAKLFMGVARDVSGALASIVLGPVVAAGISTAGSISLVNWLEDVISKISVRRLNVVASILKGALKKKKEQKLRAPSIHQAASDLQYLLLKPLP